MLKASVIFTLALTLLLLVTMLTRRLILPQWVYILVSLMGISGFLASLFVGGQFHWPYAGNSVWPLTLIFARYVMLLEASIVGWLGSRAWWRNGFLITAIATGVLLVLQLRGLVASLRRHM